MSNLVRDCVENFPETFSGVHLHRWIVTYPADKFIRPLNNWGQVDRLQAVPFWSVEMVRSQRSETGARRNKREETGGDS